MLYVVETPNLLFLRLFFGLSSDILRTFSKRKKAYIEMNIYSNILNFIINQEKTAFGIAENTFKEIEEKKEVLEDFKDYL